MDELGQVYADLFGDAPPEDRARMREAEEAEVRRLAAEQAAHFADEIAKLIGDGQTYGPGWPE